MGDVSYDETVRALSEAGVLDQPEGQAVESGESGGILLDVLGNGAPLAVAALAGGKLFGQKQSGNPVADVVTTVTETIGADGKSTTETKTSGSSTKKTGIVEKIGSIPDALTAPLQSSVQSILEEFAGTSGSNSIGGQFAAAMQEISQKDRQEDNSLKAKHKLLNILPDISKSVNDFVPGL